MKTILLFIFCALTLAANSQNTPGQYSNFYDYEKAFYDQQSQVAVIDNVDNETEGETEITHFLRLKWLMEPRVFPSGNWVNIAQRSLDAEKTLGGSSRSSNGAWESRGPFEVNQAYFFVKGIGKVTRLAFGPSGTLYAGTGGGGLWKRAGSTWECLTDFIPYLSISGICVDYTNENIIYILTGDADGSNTSPKFCTGVLKTTDGGNSWFKTGLSFPVDTTSFAGFRMVMHPTDPNILMVVSNQGILRTTDGGVSWNNVQTETGATFFDIEFKPNNTNIVFACTKNFVYRSTNAGQTWSVANSGATINADGNVTRTALEVTAAAANVVYVLCARDVPGANPNGFIRLLKSTNSNSSTTFSTISSSADSPNLFARHYSGVGFDSQANYDCGFTVSPTNSNEIWVGGINMWKSGSGGIPGSWSLQSYWANDGGTSVDRLHADIHDILFHNDDLYVANDGGVNYHDIGAIDPNWDEWYQGLNASQFYKLELDPTDAEGNTLLGSQDNGVMKYDGDGNFEILATGDGGEGIVDPTDHNRYYFTLNDNLFKDSCDPCVPGVQTPWMGCGCPDAGGGTAWVDRAMEIDPANHSILYAGFTCLFVSTNEAGNWTWFSDLPCSGGTIRDIDFDASHRVWVVKQGAVYRQDSPGANSFTNVTADLPVSLAQLTSLACSDVNAQMAFVTFSGYNAAEKVYQTIDGGLSWINISIQLPNVPVNCIVYEPTSDDAVYIGTDVGVFYSDNSIPLWTPFRNGMPSVMVTDLEIGLLDNKLYASTFGRGLWRSDLFSGCHQYVKMISGTITTDTYSGPFQYTGGHYSYRATDYITTNMPMEHGLGQEINLISEGYINMSEGFEVKNSSEFRALSDAYCFNSSLSNLKGVYVDDTQEEGSQPDINSNDSISLSVGFFPNPFSNYIRARFNYKTEEMIEVSIKDVLGRQIYSTVYPAGAAGFEISTDHFTTGSYFIQVKNGLRIFSDKIIKSE